MPDISKIGTVATGNISKVGTVTYNDTTISSVLGADVPSSGGGGGGEDPGGGGGGGTAAAGYYPTTWDANNALFTGNGSTSIKTYDIDFSSSDYANATIVGETVEIYFMYTTKANSSGWRGDPQLYRYDLTGITGQNYRNPYTYVSNWKQLNSNITVYSDRYRYQLDTGSFKVSGLTFGTNIQSSTSSYGKWVYKSYGGTPSSNTGVSASGYIYYEASSTGYNSSNIKASFLKHQAFTATSDSMRFRWYNYGQYIGSLNIGIRVL